MSWNKADTNFRPGERVSHLAKHADRMRGTVTRAEDAWSVWVRRDSDGREAPYMEGELQRETC